MKILSYAIILLSTLIVIGFITSALAIQTNILKQTFYSIITNKIKNRPKYIEPITLEKIFNNQTPYTPNQDTRTLITTGDVMLGRFVNFKTQETQNFNLPFENTASLLRSADLVFINLENPLIDPCPTTTSGMKFCSYTKNIEGLKYAGIDVANLANNHIGNYGDQGIKTTVGKLSEAGISYTGLNNITIKDVRGLKFAFIGFNDVAPLIKDVSIANKELIIKMVKDAREQADIVIVAFHWGNEYTINVTERQKEFAHTAIDAGANLVTGNHPHWIQPIEIYNNGVIFYSHGNFVFDQFWSKKVQEGIVGKFIFDGKILAAVEISPIVISNNGQPRFTEGDIKQTILNDLKSMSVQFATQIF